MPSFRRSFSGYALSAQNLAVIINDSDPKSVEVGAYYVKIRKIPTANVVHVNIPVGREKLSITAFQTLKSTIDAALSDDIQAIVMIWATPYAVECNSITSAYTLGFNANQCQNTCSPGSLSAYFDSASKKPFSDVKYRISMLLPVVSVTDAKALIDRGLKSDYSAPKANAYFLSTSDINRNSRARFFPQSGEVTQRYLTIKTLKADSIANERDIMFYETGLAKVPSLETLRFLPGALADHLTSFGGDLLNHGQMSSMKWLEAGATASYGTVSEPCNYWQKFPNPAVLMKHYLNGASAVEAYWKSVAWPTQGVFIGEPLASPYRR
ncbi:TIGR03790 family protein [Methylovorus sp. MM2]|uniref:TIGR03790 family protein n=1 Tax=Methylovorus sp. MM2 TaxID=1848038 RepID=UPI0007E154D6|nr:TIGR03790 family protein [Methylovorus sp. MM2]OAM51344.1 TIGR03790 family protein [Methylovorus sp. MM2]